MTLHWCKCTWQTHFAHLPEISFSRVASFCQSTATPVSFFFCFGENGWKSSSWAFKLRDFAKPKQLRKPYWLAVMGYNEISSRIFFSSHQLIWLAWFILSISKSHFWTYFLEMKEAENWLHIPINQIKVLLLLLHQYYTMAFKYSLKMQYTVWVKKKGNRDSILNLSKSKRQIITLLSVDDSIFIFLSYGTLVIHNGSGMAAQQSFWKACQNCLRPSFVIGHKAVQMH